MFNALDLMNNKDFLEKLKFGVGDGNLQYYLFNWRCPTMKPEQVRLIRGTILIYLIFCSFSVRSSIAHLPTQSSLLPRSQTDFAETVLKPSIGVGTF